MGRLTDDMAQLRRNIDGSRESRLAQQNARVSSVCSQIAGFAAARARDGQQDAYARAAFVTGNANDINRLLNDFRNNRRLAGQQAHEDRAAFVGNVSKDTRDLLGGFNADRRSMAERSSKDRSDFIANLTNGVAAFINEASQDRAGAHAVFFGAAASKKKTAFPV
jgi:hypothetical protein